MKRYYVIAVKAGQADTATANLAKQGFTTYNPLMEVHKMQRGKPVTIRCQLFDGYMFVKFDVHKCRWRAITGTKGVYGLLGYTGDRVSPLPVGFVEALRRLQRNGCVSYPTALQVVASFAEGDSVTITDGALKGVCGKVLKVNAESVTLIAALLGRVNTVHLPKIAIAHTSSQELGVR